MILLHSVQQILTFNVPVRVPTEQNKPNKKIINYIQIIVSKRCTLLHISQWQRRKWVNSRGLVGISTVELELISLITLEFRKRIAQLH